MYARVLSPTAMEMFEECPRKYWYKTNNIEQQRTKSGQIGTAFHELMETYINFEYNHSIEEAMEYVRLHRTWFGQEVADEVLGIARRWIKHNKQRLPRLITIGGVEFPQTEVIFGPPGDKVHGTRVPPQNVVEFESGLRVHGFIDLVYASPIPNGEVELVVLDWKTHKFKFHRLHLKRQAQIYAMVLHRMTGYPIRVEFAFVRHAQDPPVTWRPNEFDFENLEKELLMLQQRIQGFPNQPPPKGWTGDQCHWCPWKHACQDFLQWTAGNNWPNFATFPTEHLYIWWDEINNRHNSIRRMREELKAALLSRMDAEQVDGFEVFDRRNPKLRRKYTLTYSQRKVWSEYAKEIIANEGGLDNMHPDLIAELELNHRATETGSPYLRRQYSE